MTANNRIPNRLINEKSPYLLQHAYNPVNWYPWCDEAFAKAKAEDKPIFLSIGYSTCHWCHVMEKESFEDEEVAEILNKYFVSIKVDREERPDIDNIYMSICQSLTGQGGWPLTIIMTYDKEPVYAGTYLPKISNYSVLGLIDLLVSAEKIWKSRKKEFIETGKEIAKSINNNLIRYKNENLQPNILDKAYRFFNLNFDKTYGGFGTRPKFPTPHNLSFLLRYYKYFKDENALHMVEKTIEGMYRGGIFDHIGFGFSRYSTDEKWLVPHFEKMLYDNALISHVCAEVFLATGKEFFKDISEKIFAYILRDMTSPEGGFYCAEDADSEGEEGKFYVWDKKEVENLLTQEESKFFSDFYNISENGNFNGKNIPNLIGKDIKSFEELDKNFEEIRKKLFNYREKRVHPHKDDKILTSWNGLMIGAMAFGGRAFGEKKYIVAAEKCAGFLLNNMFSDKGRLMERYREGSIDHLGFIDDYAFFIWGLIELYEAALNIKYLENAVNLNNQMTELFWDEKEGGFYLYGKDSENLIIRPKEIYDGAMPSGNSVALSDLIRLSKLTENSDLYSKASRLLDLFGGNINSSPESHINFLSGYMFMKLKGSEIVIAGEPENQNTINMINEINRRFLPFTVFILKDSKQTDAFVSYKTTAYVCKNFSCYEPTTDIKTFCRLLDE